ncbi:MAG: M48 family metallopeptidase [Gammaproteobacteria bacterium]|nr:M48 family metallopeptidase [Gammaproteobacteria bacterium]
MIRFIPLQQENQWFADINLTASHPPQPGDKASLETDIESYMQQLVAQLRNEQNPNYRFSIHLLTDDTPNAFILPGGNIFVTSGLLALIESENGLAMVLAHEMAHHYHRDPLRALGRGVVISLAIMVISGIGDSSMADGLVANTATLTSLSFSREQERKADALGIELLRRYYGHANGSVEFFEAIRKLPQTELLDFFNTHPGVDERIVALRSHANEVNGKKVNLPEVIGRYLEFIEND